MFSFTSGASGREKRQHVTRPARYYFSLDFFKSNRIFFGPKVVKRQNSKPEQNNNMPKVNKAIRRKTNRWARRFMILIFVVLLTQMKLALHLLREDISADIPRRGRPTIFGGNDVVQFDSFVQTNIRETQKGAYSFIEWLDPNQSGEHQFKAVPLSATVDRRPLIVRKQLIEDKEKLSNGGRLLGCALSSSIFLSHLQSQDLNTVGHGSCDVCFQFSNWEDMKSFVPGSGYNPTENEENAVPTKCFDGKATAISKFAKWQGQDERFIGFGYPWTVDCILPNGIRELTCTEISKMEKEIEERDELQKIYFETRLAINWRVGDSSKKSIVHSVWPWSALMSHDDDRFNIAKALSKSWNDSNSGFVPKKAEELKLAHVVGPGYDKTDFEGHISLKSVKTSSKIRGGLHPRLLSNLYHFIRNAPGSTHIIAIVDGQAQRSYEYLWELLETPISILYANFGQIIRQDKIWLESLKLIPVSAMNQTKKLRVPSNGEMTLMDLLRHRKIKIRVVPIITPSLLIEKTVCGGQYVFTNYLAARYSADYQVIMFLDGDTAVLEKSEKLQSVLYDRFFSSKSSKCAGHRIPMIEQYVSAEYDNTEGVLACTADITSDMSKWNYAMRNCDLKEGHIVARTDSIFAFNVHHPDTLPKYVPTGVEDCITPGNKRDNRYFLTETEFVQLHLRDRQRKEECTCFVNQET